MRVHVYHASGQYRKTRRRNWKNWPDGNPPRDEWQSDPRIPPGRKPSLNPKRSQDGQSTTAILTAGKVTANLRTERVCQLCHARGKNRAGRVSRVWWIG